MQGGAPVHVTGLSWKRDGDDEYTHHQFRAHHEHVAAAQGPYYHGTRADLKPGDWIEPGHETNFPDLFGQPRHRRRGRARRLRHQVPRGRGQVRGDGQGTWQAKDVPCRAGEPGGPGGGPRGGSERPRQLHRPGLGQVTVPAARDQGGRPVRRRLRPARGRVQRHAAGGRRVLGRPGPAGLRRPGAGPAAGPDGDDGAGASAR